MEMGVKEETLGNLKKRHTLYPRLKSCQIFKIHTNFHR
jgi:hypothetical protein